METTTDNPCVAAKRRRIQDRLEAEGVPTVAAATQAVVLAQGWPNPHHFSGGPKVDHRDPVTGTGTTGHLSRCRRCGITEYVPTQWSYYAGD